MPKPFVLCGAILCLCVTAAAQESARNSVPAPTGRVSFTASAPQYSRFERPPWQFALAYQLVRFNNSFTTSNLHGFSVSLTRYGSGWLGVEAELAPAFGSTPDGQRAKFLWYGGGPHLAYRGNAKFEPWVHGLFGGANSYPQTSRGGVHAWGYALGGGVDLKLRSRLFWRIQGDYLGTRFFGLTQNSLQFKTGFVLSFF